MDLDAELIEARLQERAHALGRTRGPAQPAHAPAEGASGVAPLQKHAAGPRRAGFRWGALGAVSMCIDCASEIASERLAAVPRAERCMACQRSFERSLGTGLARPLSH